MHDTLEARYVSQYSTEELGLQIHVQGVLADPDGNAVTVRMTRDDTAAVVFTRAASRVGTGEYETIATAAETSVPGFYTVRWTYQVGGVEDVYETALQVGRADPNYDDLAENMKGVIANVWYRFADLYDSPNGGPHLQVYFQTHFGRGRMAQLLRTAVGKLNTMAQPFQTYTLDDGEGGAQFPVAKWGPLLEQVLYVETIRHLRRSYVEQPMFMGGNVTRLDRRDYMDRWGEILRDEEATLRSQLDVFKISNMGLGKPQVLVSGGVYGRYGPTRYAGMAARPRYWARFFAG